VVAALAMELKELACQCVPPQQTTMDESSNSAITTVNINCVEFASTSVAMLLQA